MNPEDATRANQTIDQHSEAVAKKWKDGLAGWGIDNDRVQEYRRAARFSIYTPGSEAGLQISILQSLAAPSEGWSGNEEILRERISGIVSALLALIGIDAQPVEDNEHVFMSNIFEFNWRNGTDLSMEQLILQVQNPPFKRMGVFEVDDLVPPKERLKLAKKLNNIIASPTFQYWIGGEPLHIPSLLYTKDGHPRTTIFYIAHLNDAERMFIITLILEGVLAWMRTLSGSTSLRALLYMDEMFGLFPPYPRNPATKEPILRLLKQARAFGVGLVLATQNPVDLDYKGLSNAGTWWIGKMQTDNDRRRVLEGLDTTREATTTLDMGTVRKLIGGLGQRKFILHNVHEEESPILMETRWSMSYLRGPLTRDQIKTLMANQRSEQKVAQPRKDYLYGTPSRDAEDEAQREALRRDAPAFETPPVDEIFDSVPVAAPPVPPERALAQAPIPSGFTEVQPSLRAGVAQYFLPTDFTPEQAVKHWEQWSRQPTNTIETHRRLLYRPSLLAQATVRFDHKKSMSNDLRWFAFVVPRMPHVPYLDWAEYQSEPFDPHALEPHPFMEAYYAELPAPMQDGGGLKDLKTNLEDWIYNNAQLFVWHNPTLKMYSALNQDWHDFQSQVHAAARQARDEELDTVASKFDKQLDRLEEQARVKSMRLESAKEDLGGRKREELLSGAESAYRLFKGNAYRTVSRVAQLRRTTANAEEGIELKEYELLEIADKLDETEYEMESALRVVDDKWRDAVAQIDEIPVTPYKKDISMVLYGIGWVPYWDISINGQQLMLPASSSGLSQAQDDSVGQEYYSALNAGW